MTLWTVSHQVRLSMGFSRQEYWNGLLYPASQDLLHPRVQPASVSCIGSWVLYQWCHLRSHYYYSKRIQIRTSQGKTCRGWNPGLGMFPLWGLPILRYTLPSCIGVCRYIHGALPIQKAHLSSGVQRFYLGFVEGIPVCTNGKESTCQCRRHRRLGFDPWVRKIPWRSKWQPTPVFLPGKSHGQRSQAFYSQWGCKELDMTERLNNKSQKGGWGWGEESIH